MNKEKLIRHYQWQIRRLNKRIDESDWANGLAKYLKDLDGTVPKPCYIDLDIYEGQKRLAISLGYKQDVGSISIVIFLLKARDGFINKIIKLRGN